MSDPNTPPAPAISGETPPAIDLNAPAPMDWTTHIPKEYAGEKLWESFKGKPLGDVLKTTAEAQKMIGSSIRLPSEKDKPEDRTKKLDDIYTKLGRPAKAEEYKSGPLPEGLALSEPHDAAFKGVAHKLGLNQAQVDGLYQWFGGYLGEGQSSLSTSRKAGETALREEWGPNYEQNHALASGGFKHLAGKVLGEGAQSLLDTLERTGVANDPGFVKVFAALGKEMKEDGFITGDSDVSEDNINAQISELMQSKAYTDRDDMNHAAQVQKVNSLFQQLHNPILSR